MGFTTDLLGSQTGSLLVISACMLYLAGSALALRRFAANRRTPRTSCIYIKQKTI